nr:EOG090X0C5Y [Eulimnadia texana]
MFHNSYIINSAVSATDSSTVPSLIDKTQNVLEHGSGRDNNPLAPVRDPSELDAAVPGFVPTFNLAAYVNKSPLLQEFVKLGVELHKWDKRQGVSSLVLRKDFQTDIRPVIQFLVDNKVSPHALGTFLTKNPLIFRESLDDLQVRVNYLQAKRFSKKQIGRILEHNPNWLLFSTERIDNRLGFFQQTFALKGQELRNIATVAPKLITWSLWDVKLMNFSLLEELGFTKDQMKSLLIKKPNLWLTNRDSLKKSFDVANNLMNLSHETILQFPQVLDCREFRLRQRHLYLEFLSKCQYDPQRENYVSPLALVAGSDAEFCENVAKTPVQHFNSFLKTL